MSGILKWWTMFLSDRASRVAARHAVSCNICTDEQYLEVFRAVATHVKQLRASTKGMDSDEAGDFIAAHLHAAAMRSTLAVQQRFNELVMFVSQMETVLTCDQKAEFERLKAFVGRIN